MKLVSKIIVLLIVWVMLVSAQGSVTIDQVVRNLPIANTAGCHWAIYNPHPDTAESRVCYESTTSSVTTPWLSHLFWSADIGLNFPSPPPAVGELLLIIGSWDSAYVNPGEYGDKTSHTGFYWLYSDILDDPNAIHWRDDTLRPLPKPDVYKTGFGGGANDTIWVEIPNPRETRYTGQTVYDVLGYWLVADSTGTGTPNEFNASSAVEIGFIPVDGVYGDTTVFWMLESDSFLPWDHWTTYFAYKLVARPDTVEASADTMGYSTYYWSQNSDAIDVYQIVIAIEENKDIKHSSVQLEISPNPFTNKTDITCSMGHSAKSTELKIFDVSGRLIRDFPIDLCNHNKSVKSVRWYGTDESGKPLPSGVYFVQAKNGDLTLTNKVILQR